MGKSSGAAPGSTHVETSHQDERQGNSSMRNYGRQAGSRRTIAALGAAAVVAATAAAPGAVAAVPTADIAQVTVRPDPTYQGDPFEGWGTSLVWFANATGDYPDEIREQLAEMVFGEDGLNLNIARYNIGGGNAPDVPDYLRLGGAVEGWWQAPDGTTRTDTDWWDPDNPDHWNWDADQTQRWWIDAIKDDITHWEAFSNSPPWFQTVSGYVTGGFNGSTDQLKTESIDDFTTYLVRVVEYLEDAHGIEIDTLDPFNEPNTSYWSTRLGADGEPVGGRQEGAHMGPALQQQVIRSLAARLAEADTDAVISAMDETNPGTFLTNWNSYPDDVRAMVDQLNVHTYGTGQRTAVRDVAKGEDKPLWMSEVEGSWGNGQDFESMVPGLGMADRIVDDLRELEPTAWVFWQPVEDYDNMKPGGESALGANWGSIQIPFNCTAEDTLATCPIYTNTKFDTVRNFTHYIRPGDRLVAVNDPSSVAAVSETGASVVHINDTGEARAVTLDLSAFGTVHPHATVTPVVTSADGALVEGAPVRVQDRTATLQVPAESVTTFVIDGARGAAADAALVQDGHVYRIQGAQSGKSLTATETGTVIATTDPADIAQLWSLRQMIGGTSNRSQYAVSTVDGRQLPVDDGELAPVHRRDRVLRPVARPADHLTQGPELGDVGRVGGGDDGAGLGRGERLAALRALDPVDVAVLDERGVGRGAASTIDDEGGDGLGWYLQGRGPVLDPHGRTFHQGTVGAGDHRGHRGVRMHRAEGRQVQGDGQCLAGVVDVHDRSAGLADHRHARGIVHRHQPVTGLDVVGEVADGVELGVGVDGAGRQGVLGGAVERNLDAAPVGTQGALATGLHVVVVLDGLPEHPCRRLELAQVVNDPVGHAQTGDHGLEVLPVAP